MSWYDTYFKKDKKYEELISLKIGVENIEDYNNTVQKSLSTFKKQKQIQK